MALGNLPIAANGLPLVPLGNDIRAPHHYWKKFLLWLFAVTSNEAKTLPQKMGLPNLEVYYVNVRSYKDCYPNIYWKHFFSLVLMRRVVCILQVNVNRCMGCYLTAIGKDFLLWLFAQPPPMRQKCSNLKCVS